MDALEVIDLHCPACGHLSRYPTVHVGKTVTCPSCKHGHVLPPKPVGVGSGTQPATTAGHESRTYGDTDAAGAGDKVLFICSACKYRARIPSQYVGMAVRCPSCDAAQIATPEEGAAAPTGRTVQISRMPSAAATKGKTTVRPGNILFTCGLCNFEAQLAKHYVGKAIRCPGCHAPQVVVDSAADAAEAPASPPKDGEAPQPSDPRFICISCGYRARIPNQYMGLAVTCPKCDTVQIASPEDSEAPATGDTVKIAKLKTSEPVAPASRGPGEEKVSFACSACGFKAQFGKSLLGMAIKCPGCQATQVVGGAAVPGSISGGPPAAAPAQPASAASVLASAGGGDKVRFTCTACGFKARIPSHYAGQTIHCPGCNVVQLVLRSGQTSGAATGNTQVLSVVQTADEATAKPAASAPPQTPAFGNVAIAEPAATKPGIDLDDLAGAMPGGMPTAKPAAAKPAPAPVIAKPATAPVARPATPAAPVAPAAPAAAVTAKPAAPAAKPAPAEDPKQAATLPMVSEDPLSLDTPPKGSEAQPSSSGKVVRRNSGRHSVAGSGKAATPLPEDGEPAKPEAAKPAPAKPAPAKAAPKPSAKPEPRAPASSSATPAASERKAPMPPEVQPVARTSPMLMVLLVVILLAMLGGMGFGGWQLVQIQNQLGEAQKQLSAANDKLTKAEKDAEKAKSEADQAKKAQEDEAAARKTADDKALALQKQIDEQKQAAEKQAAELQKKLDEQQKALDDQKAAPKDK